MSLEEKINQHLKAYNKKNMVMSFTVRDDPNYIAVLKMGEEALPILVSRLRDCINSPNRRDYGIHEIMDLIAHINPEKIEVPEHSRGRVSEVANIYLEYFSPIGIAKRRMREGK